jgi:hypothetical protein
LRAQGEPRAGRRSGARGRGARRRLRSWRVWNGAAVEASEMGAGVMEAPRPFLAGLSVLIGVLFAVVILTQGAAGLVLNGCER